MSGAAYRIEGLRWELGPDFTLAVDALEIPRGRTTLLLGPSASGKSTLLRLLGRVEGQYFPSTATRAPVGEIWLAGEGGEREILALGERELMRSRLRGGHVGVVFQREGLFVGRSVEDNVVWPLLAHGVAMAEARERAAGMLARVELPATREVANLSGGERKRLALARTLALDPPVLLLDEPLTGLDPRALDELLALLEELVADADRTVVMVTHQREDIERLGEHLVLMRRGKVALSGPRAEHEAALEAFLSGEEVVG